MRYYDITLTISKDLPVWPNNPSITLERVNRIEAGANSNVSRLDMGVHSGTHVDAPFHFLMDGYGVDRLDLDILIGPALVVAFPDSVAEISAVDIEQAHIPPGTQRVLFKTRNSGYWQRGEKQFQPGFVGLSVDGAEALIQLGIRLVGIDYLSVAPYKKSRPTHEALLKASMIVIEGINLSEVPAGLFQLICLPLKLEATDGAPARVILMG